MIQGMVDLFIAPKAPEVAKPVSVPGDAAKDFAKILEEMAGTVQTVFDLIGNPSEEETETEEAPLPLVMAAIMVVPAPLENEAKNLDVAVAPEMPTAPQIVPKDIAEPEPEIMLDEQPELPEQAATAVLTTSETMPGVKQPKAARKNEAPAEAKATKETEEIEEIEEIKETDAKAPTETPRPEAKGKPADVPKVESPAKEPAKFENSEKFEMPEKSEKLDKPEKLEPTRRAAFSEFLTDISEQKSARNDPTATAPTQRPAPQFNLLNTGRAAFTEGLESVVRFARAEGIDKATLIIDPPALGRVSVEIVSTANGIETSLRVSNEQVRALVQDQIVQLKHALQQMGVQVAEFSVDIGQQEKEREQFSQNKQKNRSRIADKESENEEEEIFRVDLRKGLLHWIA